MIQIAIDGPSGAGKSTLAKALAARLGIVYVDTGALYRTIGYYVRSKDTDPKDEAAVAKLLPQITIELKYENGTQKVLLNGEDLGDRIRTPEMSMYASAVSSLPAVRTFLLDTQRDIAKKNSVIMDGRDIGTVILPNADVKIFLVANDECRARRRLAELAQKGIADTFENVLADMRARDRADATRAVAPAVAAPDAITLDNSDLTPDECVERMLAIVAEKTGVTAKSV
ncbi:MAG: (d)CMP kinase [Clostridia bacterium]|nr:(d)CMP kinase [Clostridia bacterium]